jgi:hypothetical protein
MIRVVKAKGTTKRKKNDGRISALRILRMNNWPELSKDEERYRLVRILLNGITLAGSGASIATYFIRGEKEEKKALGELANWLRSDEPPPKDILNRLGDIIDPDLRSSEPQRFELVYRKKGIGKDHKAVTKKSLEMVKNLIDIYIASGYSVDQACEEISKISDVDIRYVKKLFNQLKNK